MQVGIYAYDGFTTTSQDEAEAHSVELILAGLPDNYRTEGIYETERVKVGSHEEEQGHYEKRDVVVFRYCTECGLVQ